MYIFALEWMALAVCLMFLGFTYEKEHRFSYRKKLFRSILLLNIISILLDFLSQYITDMGEVFPLWVHYGVNTVYLLVCFFMISTGIFFVASRMLSPLGEEKTLRNAKRWILLTQIFMVFLLAANIPTGIIFYIDANYRYCRGEFWVSGYVQMIFLFLVLAYCYLRQGELVDRAGKKMITVGFPVLLMIFVCKLIYPELMVNGMMGAVGAGVIFLSFESHISELDVLTRQGNLSAFLDYMDMLLEEKSEFDIFMVGSRNFSGLNSVVGFGEGNRILCRLSDWLEKELPKSRIFRTSASSFAAVLVGKDRLRKQDWQTLCSSFPTVMKKEEVSYRVVPYFAVYHYDGREKTAAKILEALEYVGKTAKQEKGGLLEFDQGMRVKMGKRDEVLKCLYSSLKKHRFEIWYQPIFHVASGRFRSAEALIRLKDGKGEYIPPDEFIPTAEQTGLIEEISMQRQRGILAVLKETTSEELEYVSVNLADQQLQTGYYLAEMDRIAREWGVGAQRISYEITERVIMNRDRHLRENIDRILEQGHRIMADDFGTGYTNFLATLEFPFSIIKLDRGFLHSDQELRYANMQGIIRLFHENGKQVVVEGVETREQMEEAVSMGADYLQGFYLAKPMPKNEFLNFLRQAAGNS